MKSQKMACFRCNKTENFMFSLKYRQRKVDLNTSEKSSLRPAILCENFTFTEEYVFEERCCFLTFSFEGKFRKYDISVKRKNTETNENMIFSLLFTNFRKTKILFFMQCPYHENVIIIPVVFLNTIIQILITSEIMLNNDFVKNLM